MKTTKSISIEDDLWERAKKATGNDISLSRVLSVLLEKWLDGEIDLTVTYEPTTGQAK